MFNHDDSIDKKAFNDEMFESFKLILTNCKLCLNNFDQLHTKIELNYESQRTCLNGYLLRDHTLSHEFSPEELELLEKGLDRTQELGALLIICSCIDSFLIHRNPKIRYDEELKIVFDSVCSRIMSLLVENPSLDPSMDSDNLIEFASITGWKEGVEILLKDSRVDPSCQNNCPIIYASRYGHVKIVEILLQDPRIDPSDNANKAIRDAAYRGHTEIVKLLLKDPRVDPYDCNNYAIRWAYTNKHYEIVKELFPKANLEHFSQSEIEAITSII